MMARLIEMLDSNAAPDDVRSGYRTLLYQVSGPLRIKPVYIMLVESPYLSLVSFRLDKALPQAA